MAQKEKKSKAVCGDVVVLTWPRIRAHGLEIGPIGVMFQCASFRFLQNSNTKTIHTTSSHHSNVFAYIHVGMQVQCISHSLTRLTYLTRCRKDQADYYKHSVSPGCAQRFPQPPKPESPKQKILNEGSRVIDPKSKFPRQSSSANFFELNIPS